MECEKDNTPFDNQRPMYCPKIYFNLGNTPPAAKTLVAYFSATGRTKKVAENLASVIGADRYEILPAIPYSERDLDWRNGYSRSSMEMRDPDSRPELTDASADVDGHDVIFLGFPIWWHTAPSIIRTFLESYSFSWKKIILFATSGGDGMDGIADDLLPSAPKAYFVESRLLTGDEGVGDIYKWADRF